MRTLKKFMENYSAFQALKDFEEFIANNSKKKVSDQIALIQQYLLPKIGSEKTDLLNLFSEHVHSNFREFKRKSLTEVASILSEAQKKNIVFAFGRFNPPTKGHSHLIDQLIHEAKAQNAEPRLYVSLTQDDDKNPLSPKDKQKYIKSVYKGLDVRVDAKNAFDVMTKLSTEGNVGHVVLLTGADQLSGYKSIQKYIDKGEYKVDSFEAKSIGERNDSSDGLDGISASKVRKMIRDGESQKKIKDILMKGLSDKYVLEIIGVIK